MDSLKKLMRLRNLSQKEVAMHVGVTQPTVSDWVNKKKTPEGENLARFAEMLEVDPSVILGLTLPESEETAGRPKPTDEDIKFALFGGADGVTDEDYEDVKRYAAFVKARKNGGSL